MIVAIDGPAGVGKSTIAKMLAKRCGLYYINSGNFYRAVAFHHIQSGRSFTEENAIRSAHECDLEIKSGVLNLNGKPIEDRLHNPEIDMLSSSISSIIDVRHHVNAALQKAARDLDVIAEGRDITTVVFPHADLKFYFDADIAIRTKRRHDQRESSMTLSQLQDTIKSRDENDRSKVFGALKRADDATYIDTSYLTIDEVCDKVVKMILPFMQIKDQENNCGN